jgi:hypothetical protein
VDSTVTIPSRASGIASVSVGAALDTVVVLKPGVTFEWLQPDRQSLRHFKLIPAQVPTSGLTRPSKSTTSRHSCLRCLATVRLAPPAGVEPATWWVEATRSIQLSYGGQNRLSLELTPGTPG